MINAVIMALILQCGTTAAATIIMFFTPPTGFGCHSLAYLLYGGIAIIIMFLSIISTVIARISEIRDTAAVKGSTAFIAIALRRISLSLAFANATGLIVFSCLQFFNLLDNCFCNASVIGRGADSYIDRFLRWFRSRR
jgi:hypothetical protein